MSLWACVGTSLITLWCLACVGPCRVRVSVLVCGYVIWILIPPFTIIKNFVIQGDGRNVVLTCQLFMECWIVQRRITLL